MNYGLDITRTSNPTLRSNMTCVHDEMQDSTHRVVNYLWKHTAKPSVGHVRNCSSPWYNTTHLRRVLLFIERLFQNSLIHIKALFLPPIYTEKVTVYFFSRYSIPYTFQVQTQYLHLVITGRYFVLPLEMFEVLSKRLVTYQVKTQDVHLVITSIILC